MIHPGNRRMKKELFSFVFQICSMKVIAKNHVGERKTIKRIHEKTIELQKTNWSLVIRTQPRKSSNNHLSRLKTKLKFKHSTWKKLGKTVVGWTRSDEHGSFLRREMDSKQVAISLRNKKNEEEISEWNCEKKKRCKINWTNLKTKNWIKTIDNDSKKLTTHRTSIIREVETIMEIFRMFSHVLRYYMTTKMVRRFDMSETNGTHYVRKKRTQSTKFFVVWLRPYLVHHDVEPETILIKNTDEHWKKKKKKISNTK